MNIHWLQHADHEDSGCIAPFLAARGHAVRGTRLHAGERLPALDAFDWLIVMGGPMNIHEHGRHPWLAAEKELIREALLARKRVLGICLGAQLLADVLGGPVSAGAESEIGWFPVDLTPAARQSPVFAGLPGTFLAFHWHGDTYALPPGARHMARSAAFEQQAFAWRDRVVGLQFHLEVTAANARVWLKSDAPAPARYVQSPAQILADAARFEENNRLMRRVLAAMERVA